jgi:gamma-glutamylcyclotransferase (GGCT)/AIG2-like uncharacterized protein YtfP
MKLYFAYGANLNLEGMRFRCPDARPVERFVLPDWRLAFSGVATIQSRKNSRVFGALWEITTECEENLDVFEGFPYLYTKIHITHQGLDFMAYVMNDDPPAPPARSYFDTIAQGYRDWNLPLNELYAARDLTLAECN